MEEAAPARRGQMKAPSIVRGHLDRSSMVTRANLAFKPGSRQAYVVSRNDRAVPGQSHPN